MDALEQDRKLINDLAAWTGKRPSRMATDLGMAATTLARPASGKATTRLGRATLQLLRETYPDFPGWLHGDDGDRSPDHQAAHAIDDSIPMVGIRHADAAFGLGAAFADEPTEVQVLQFPKVWVESITYSPAELLSWVRARGRSMEPTINDGDLILLDHSERKVRDQDDIWAFTVGDTRAIKRLRVKGDRFIILSDNPSVPPDEEPIDFVNIVARVVFVGKRT